jgi:WD40 repeat protein
VVWSVAFSPGGNRIVSGSHDKSVRMWDAKTGKQLKEMQGHTAGIWSVAFSPNGDRIVSGSSDKSVRVWDAMTGESIEGMQGHPLGFAQSHFRLMATELSLVPPTNQCGCGMQKRASS